MKSKVLRHFNLLSLNLFLYLASNCMAQSPQTLAGITISFSNNGSHASFILTSSQGGSVASTWLAVGLNSASGAMVFRDHF